MIRAKVQRLGTFLAGMVIPNIPALIAWGLITALFIPRGWIPNEHLAKLVSPLIMYLLPVLIGSPGGAWFMASAGAWSAPWQRWVLRWVAASRCSSAL